MLATKIRKKIYLNIDYSKKNKVGKNEIINKD